MLAELFELRTKAEEVPWESEATEELLEDIIKEKYGKYKKKYPEMAEELEETAKKVLKVAKEFIRMCRKIGGKPKVREYASRFFGTIDMVCYLDDVEKITSLWYDGGIISITTEKGSGSIHLPEGLNRADINIKNVEKAESVDFSDYLMRYFGIRNYVEGFMRPSRIDMDIYKDHIKLTFRSKEEGKF
ncbi:MAG TPA: hypothetical protein ENG66_05095 [Thermococcus sp.]|nr:MAG: hypothetical protein DRP04_06315 [Archaeoglobales archaeon]HDH44749.1 hypothetical protein [Thermococcus sp.]